MDLFQDFISPSIPLSSPVALTIGTFDGVHLGHRFLLHRMRSLVKEKGSIVVVTFTTHPAHILKGIFSPPLLSSPSLKTYYLEKEGLVDVLYLLPFTKELAETSYACFLEKWMEVCPFSFLVLGKGASFGKDRKGTEEAVFSLSPRHFSPCYIDKMTTSQGVFLSSHQIRTHILAGELNRAETLLGHPYILEIDSFLISVSSLPLSFSLSKKWCIPPSGKYRAILVQNGQALPVKIAIEGILLHFLSIDLIPCSCSTFISHFQQTFFSLQRTFLIFLS